MLTAEDILGPGGRIAARLTGYEQRPQQLEMARAVGQAIGNQQHLVVEAGTGVGKSFAYLVPAILAATESQEGTGQSRRVVVSTHTISLQEQLVAKDLPLLRAVIPREFTAVLVKGRSNYISVRRLRHAVERSRSLFDRDEELDQLRQLQQWVKDSADGSLSDLSFRPASAVWDEVASDSSNCLGKSCPSHKECFYFRARRRASHAQILVVNHALFFSDLALRQQGVSILPDYDTVVLDEAHTLESVVGSHFGVSVTSSQVDFLLHRLYNDRTNKGLLVAHRLTEVQQMVDRCRAVSDEFFDALAAWYDQQRSNGRVRQPQLVPNPLGPALSTLSQQLERVGKRFPQREVRQDFLAAAQRLLGLSSQLDQWVSQSLPAAVYWLELSRNRRGFRRLQLSASPIHVGAALRGQLFERVPSVILTSATLAVGRPASFDFFRSRIGLSQCRALQLGSPFDFSRQARLILVRDMPDPAEDSELFERRAIVMIQRYVARTHGRAFVLFTSYAMLRRIADALTGWLTAHNLALYSQADGLPRYEMLQRFKASDRAVLFGTDSFWQGVDVPGEALQNVIITKLPFSVPDHPLLEARLEQIRHSGGSPFLEYQLPEAVIKLRQGFGRLIRSHQDTGIVVLLDPRVHTKRYGQVFLESLPECQIVQESAAEPAQEGGP